MNKTPLTSRLSPDEYVLWQGKPIKKAFFLKSVFNILLPISIIWVAFDLTGIISIFEEGADTAAFIMIPFFLLHLLPVWIYLGNIILAFSRYKNTEYVLTNKNLYIGGGIFAQEVTVRPLSYLSNLQTRVGLFDKMFHVGSIIVGETEKTNNLLSSGILSVDFVPDYEDVFKRIQSLQFGAASDIYYPNNKR